MLLQVLDADKTPNPKFSCVAYVRSDRPGMVLIEYIGDEGLAGQYPRGNSVNNKRVHIRTQPHVIADIRTSSSSTPSNVYKDMVVAGASEQLHPSSVPRNPEQVCLKSYKL